MLHSGSLYYRRFESADYAAQSWYKYPEPVSDLPLLSYHHAAAVNNPVG